MLNNSLMEMAIQIYYNRKSMLSQNSPPFMIEYNIKIEQLLPTLQQIGQLNQNHQQFCYDIFVVLSGCWEAFNLDSYGLRRFKQSLQSSLNFEENIHISYNILQCATSPIKFYQVKQHVIDNLKQNIKNNITIVREILKNDIDLQVIDDFFKDQTFLIFKSKKISSDLVGVSSFDGKRCYFSSQMRLDEYIKIFEVQIVNNLYFWFINNQNPYLIICEQIIHLNDSRGNILEPGDYYLLKVYKEHITNNGPFRMGLRNRQLTYAL